MPCLTPNIDKYLLYTVFSSGSSEGWSDHMEADRGRDDHSVISGCHIFHFQRGSEGMEPPEITPSCLTSLLKHERPISSGFLWSLPWNKVRGTGGYNRTRCVRSGGVSFADWCRFEGHIIHPHSGNRYSLVGMVVRPNDRKKSRETVLVEYKRSFKSRQ